MLYGDLRWAHDDLAVVCEALLRLTEWDFSAEGADARVDGAVALGAEHGAAVFTTLGGVVAAGEGVTAGVVSQVLKLTQNNKIALSTHNFFN